MGPGFSFYDGGITAKKVLNMAKKKKAEEGATSRLGTRDDLAIVAPIKLGGIQLKGLAWQMKLVVARSIDETFRDYKVELSLNEQPDLDRIELLKRELNDGLFKDDPRSAASTKKQIAGIEKELERKRNLCDTIEFNASVAEVKYTDGGTVFVLSFPDNTLEALNKQKGRLDRMYKVRLEPQFV